MLREFAKSIRDRVIPRSTSEQRYKFVDTGFHGDRYLQELVQVIIDNCNTFAETGANVGSTLAYVAKNNPQIQCHSCEPDPTAYEHAVKNTSNCRNASLYNEMSQEFLKRIQKMKQKGDFADDVLFWLDAHDYGFEWPLQEEISVITNNWSQGYILIDDFLVPGLDCFGYDEYDGQVCSFDYIKDSMNKNPTYRLYYPAYTDRTSKTHPLRGWGLIEFGHAQELELPQTLESRISKNIVNR